MADSRHLNLHGPLVSGLLGRLAASISVDGIQAGHSRLRRFYWPCVFSGLRRDRAPASEPEGALPGTDLLATR